MVPSSSSSSSSMDMDCYDEPCYKTPKYEVFVNYASGDIGNGFASHLTKALTREGFTICDHNKLPKGEDKSSELLKAIEDSEIYLIVFSPKYASYKECLDECVLIMDTYPKFKKRKVLPIFFHVEPFHVRNQEGSFLEAFQSYEKSVNAERVKIWRQALYKAGDKSGEPLKDWMDEEQLIREIIKEVRKMQNPQQLCYVEHRVGIESRAQDVISALRLNDQACSNVAVLGISGSGKTTIVKAVYDRIAIDFDVSCFIENIHGLYTGQDWEVKLQRDAIYRLTAGENKFKGSDGVAKLIKLLSGQKVLLILDDVYEFKQLQALGIHLVSFKNGSRIIVTTRNKLSLSNLPHTPYNIRLLDTIESFELFTRLIGKAIDKEFVDEIVGCAGGIPLVLEVWSRHFTDYETKLWPSMLKMLKKIPHEDTQKKLQISYNSLPKRSKNLFLDIACFFHGMNKDLIIKVLQEEDFFPDFEIQNLIYKFLVKCEESAIHWGQKDLLLHNVIKEMGQEVVRQENEDEPGKRTRLIGYRDVVRVFGDRSGTESIRSIKLDSSWNEEKATVQVDSFKRMSNLRFIKLDNFEVLQWSSCSNDDMSACFSFKHLKYLEWKGFPCKSLDNIDMGNVVVLILKNSKLEKLWDGDKSFKKLKILNLENSKSFIKIGGFTGLENLEQLNLYGCENLEQLDNSISCLQKLVELHLTGCIRLKKLPWEAMGKLMSLQILFLGDISEISHEVGSLISLTRFYLSYSTLNSLPNSLCQLCQLTILELFECTNLKSIPDLPPLIEELCVVNCENLVNFPSNCSELERMTSLTVENCVNLGSKGFEKVTGLRNLTVLTMSNCDVSEVSSSIENLKSLSDLDLSENTFSSLPESFSNLSKLRTLNVDYCSELGLLPPLPSELIFIDAIKCPSLDVLPFDPEQNAYTFCSKVFKESLTSIEGLHIGLSGKELPDWCTYQNSGNVISFVAPIHSDHNKICGLILCANRDKDDEYDDESGDECNDEYDDESGDECNDEYDDESGDECDDASGDEYDESHCPVIYNKTKEKWHPFGNWVYNRVSMFVIFYPLNDKTLVVEAGDTVELQFHNGDNVTSCGLRLVYENDVVDSGLVL